MSVATTAVTGLAGVLFGLAVAAPPGPMNAIIAEESVLRGWIAGFRAGLGAMTADVCFFLLALGGGIAFVERSAVVRGVMVGLGGLLMLYFAYGAARDARSRSASRLRSAGFDPNSSAVPTPGDVDDERSLGQRSDDRGPPTEPKGFRKAFVLALTNPYQIVFWLTIGVGLLQPGRLDVLAVLPFLGDVLTGALVVSTGSPALLLGFFGGIVVWIVGYPATLVAVDRQSDAFAPAVAYASAFVLAGFGALFVSEAVSTLGG